MFEKRYFAGVLRVFNEDNLPELEQHGAETLESDKMTFPDFAERYERANFIPARCSNSVKVAGKRSLAPSQSAIKPLKEHFGRRHLRAVKASDLEAYKQKRLDAPVEIERNVKIKIENPLSIRSQTSRFLH